MKNFNIKYNHIMQIQNIIFKFESKCHRATTRKNRSIKLENNTKEILNIEKIRGTITKLIDSLITNLKSLLITIGEVTSSIKEKITSNLNSIMNMLKMNLSPIIQIGMIMMRMRKKMKMKLKS